MTIHYSQSSNDQQSLTDLNYDSHAIADIARIQTGDHKPRFLSPAYRPQSLSSPPGESERGSLPEPVPFENYPFKDLHHADVKSGPSQNYLPKYPSLHHMGPLHRMQSLGSLNLPSSIHHSDDFNNTYIPNMCLKIPELFTHSEPLDRPVTNSLTSLPLQISRALGKEIQYSPRASLCHSSQPDEKVLNPTASATPCSTETSTPCSKSQENTFSNIQENNFSNIQEDKFSNNQEKKLSENQEDIQTGSPLEHFRILNLIDPQKENKLSQAVKESFAKLSPALSNIRSQKWSGILVDILSQIQHDISLDDFYNLLYNETPLFDCISNAESSDKISPDSIERRLTALKVFHLVLITFQTPRVTAGLLRNVPTQNLQVSVPKLYEILRTSLAIKIIFALVKKADSSVKEYYSVSRVTIYKLYYIICQKLIQKYPAVSDYPGFPETLTLGQLRVGKITNLVYPNTITRKIGRRGDSKAHYMGLTLNYTILDEESLRLADLEIVQLMEYFKDNRGMSDLSETKQQPESENSSTDLRPSGTISKPTFTHAVSSSEMPVHSYLDSWSVYRDADFSASKVLSTEAEKSVTPKIAWEEY